MPSGSARIFATPSASTHASGSHKIGVDLKAAAARAKESEYKYTYDFGFKQLGDPLIDFRRDYKNWAHPQDVELVILCHAEEGQHLTCAEIKVDQSSEEREAHIIGGGIGEDHIRILVKARNTYWLKYEVRMYAKQLTTAVVPLQKVVE